MKRLEKCQAGVKPYIWPSKKMKDINWSQSVPPCPGKRQIILLSLAFYCIVQIWHATYFMSFDLKQSDVGHKKGSRKIRKRTFCQTCENERRALADTFTSRPCLYSHIDWRACLKSYSERVMIFTFLTFDVLSSWFSSFRFRISMLRSTTCIDNLWSDHPTRILIHKLIEWNLLFFGSGIPPKKIVSCSTIFSPKLLLNFRMNYKLMPRKTLNWKWNLEKYFYKYFLAF